MYEELLRDIHTRATEYESRLTRIRTLNSQLISRAEKLMDEVSSLVACTRPNAGQLCSICNSKPLAKTFVSCGHVFCEDCSTKALNSTRKRCFTCRTPITEAVSVYI